MQADDVTLIEITCNDELLPEVSRHEQMAPKTQHFESIGDWEYVLCLKDKRLGETNPVPIIINHIMEMEGIETERQALFTVITELYLNALDHGVLNLQSSLKSDPEGFALYFQLRENRLIELQEGQVTFHISLEQNNKNRSILIRIEDSGEGFDHKNFNRPVKKEITRLSGRGINMINNLCESLTYYGNGNVVEAIYSWKIT